MKQIKSVRENQHGMSSLTVPLVITILLLVATSGFAIWSFMGRQDYKNNVDQKIESAVAVAVKTAETQKDNEFTEKEKLPLTSYQSPSDLGSIVVKYPKTWSSYVDSTGRGSSPLDGYFHPATVPGLNSGTAYALRLEVVSRSFSEVVKSYDTLVKSGKSTAQAYQPVNVNDVVGVRIEGSIDNQKQGIMIILPLRDKTIKLYTESNQFYNDLDNNILPNFSFTP